MKSAFDAPPVRTPFPDANSWAKVGVPSYAWMKWFQAITGQFNTLFADPPVVTGSRGGNAALASLLTALDKQGYIVDQSTP